MWESRSITISPFQLMMALLLRPRAEDLSRSRPCQGRSLSAAQLLEIRACPDVLVQERLDPADLFLVAGQRPPVARAEKIQHRQRALRVAPLRLFQLGKQDRTQLRPGRAVPRLHFLQLGDRAPAGVAELRVARGVGRILASQGLDERPIALVVRGGVAVPAASEGPLRFQGRDNHTTDPHPPAPAPRPPALPGAGT